MRTAKTLIWLFAGRTVLRWFCHIAAQVLLSYQSPQKSLLYSLKAGSPFILKAGKGNFKNIWASSWENLSSGFPTNWDSNWAWIFVWIWQGIIVSRQRTTKGLIRLRGCAEPDHFKFKQGVSGILNFHYFVFIEICIFNRWAYSIGRHLSSVRQHF